MKTLFGHLSLFVSLFLISNSIAGQDSIVTKTYLNKKVEISVPSSWTELDGKEITERFPNPNLRPSVFLSDKEGLTSLKIIEMPQDVADNEVGQYKRFHMSQMKKEANIEWLGDGLRKINNKNVGFFKVVYTERNTFAYFFFTSLNGKLLLFTFNCVDKLWPSMEDQTEKIVSSLKVQ